MVSYGTNPSDFTHTAYISMGMFLTFVICGQLSGGQGNMIITIALLFTRGSNVTMLNSIAYIVTQFAGALVGGVIGTCYHIQPMGPSIVMGTLTPSTAIPPKHSGDNYWDRSCLSSSI